MCDEGENYLTIITVDQLNQECNNKKKWGWEEWLYNDLSSKGFYGANGRDYCRLYNNGSCEVYETCEHCTKILEAYHNNKSDRNSLMIYLLCSKIKSLEKEIRELKEK